MQGLWKNDVSGWNNKGIKRKKQKLKNFYNDKLKGIYNNSVELQSSLNKNKIVNNYTKKVIKEEIDNTYNEKNYEIKYILFKRRIRLSNNFIKNNCDNCDNNKIYIDYIIDNINKHIDSLNITEEEKNNKKFKYIKNLNWCNLDIQSYHVEKNNNIECIANFSQMREYQGCFLNNKLEFKLEYKVFKVIEINGVFYKVLKENILVKNKPFVDYTWEYVKIKRNTNLFVKMYEVEENKVQSYNGLILYKNKFIDYNNLKKLNYCYGYCCNNIDFITNKTFRSREKQIIKKMLKYNNYDLNFFNRKKKWYDYC